MKKIRTIIKACTLICTIALLLILSGCVDILDKDNLNAVNPGQVWSDPISANAYLFNIYNGQMPGNVSGTGNSTDEAYEPHGTTDGWLLGTATYDSYNIWNSCYSSIRTINILLDNIDNATFDETAKKQIKAQGLFWRAWVYYKLVKSYGGVPLILSSQQPTSDLTKLQVPRSKTSECISQIIQDLDDAATDLPDNWTGSDFGKISKTAALAFKGRVLLFFASPLWEGKVGVTWQNAYDANKAALDQCTKSGNSLYPVYEDIWDKQPNSEAIMLRQYKYPDAAYYQNAVRPINYSGADWGHDMPTLDLAEAFPMKDGSAWTDGSRDLATLFKNRDQRFYATIYYNGDTVQYIADMKTNNEYLWTYFTSISDLNTLGQGVQGTNNNVNLYQAQGYITESSFYRIKSIDKTVTRANAPNGYCTVAGVGLRYAEVLLNFGEAASQIGKGNEAMDALRKIRQRAEIQPGADNNYGLKVTSLSSATEFMTAFLNERYVEFAFEGLRWDDLRRNKQFGYLRSLPQRHGLVIVLKPGESGVNKADKISNPAIYNKFTYTKVGLDRKDIAIKDQFYIYGIPTSILSQNTLLEQNNNWGGNFVLLE
ncbi:MAG: RagB/SusD family nutrient uptake outer membrane protein [Syntrophomonas sp.]